MPKIHQRRIFKTHPLDEYEDLIYNERRSGCSFQSIQRMLRDEGVSVDRSTVFRYVQSHCRFK